MSRFLKTGHSKLIFNTGILLILSGSVFMGQVHWPFSLPAWFLGSLLLGICFLDGLVYDCQSALTQVAKTQQSSRPASSAARASN